MKIPIEDLTDVILAIGDTYRDYVRSGRQVELILVAPPGGQISNQYKKRHLVAKFPSNASGATCWSRFPTNARIIKEVIIVKEVITVKEVIIVTEVKIVKELKTVKEVKIVEEVKITKKMKTVEVVKIVKRK